MVTDPHLESSSFETRIKFPAEGLTTSVTATKVGSALYRLDSVPWFAESVKFHDIIETDDIDGEPLLFRRVAQKSDWRQFEYMLSRESRESEEIRRILERVEECGGHWERVLGGCLAICLPPEVGWDPTADVVG